MKIYLLAVNEQLQPGSTWMLYPYYHNDDYGLEQDFLRFLLENPDLLTSNPQEADFHYLPVFWSRWVYNHNWGNDDLDLLKALVYQVVIDETKTFTVAQCDCGTKIEVGQTRVFLASRGTNPGIDVPLICRPHQFPAQLPPKKYIASFVGRLDTHPVRQAMAECFRTMPDAYIFDGYNGVDFFVEKVLESNITLCPRGCGGSSYRFFEAMQLAAVPLLICEVDNRPFKKYIDWDSCSFYAETPEQALKIVNKSRGRDFEAMGKIGARIWEDELYYGKWCVNVIKELGALK